MTYQKVDQILQILMGNMTESALARAVNLPKATINRVLSGRTPDPRAGTLLPIAQYFNISIEQLMGASPLPTNSPLEIVPDSSLTDIPFIDFFNLKPWFFGEYLPETTHKISSFSNIILDQNYFITRSVSNEISPLFPKNTYLIVNKKKSFVSNEVIIIYDKQEDVIILRKYVETQVGKFLVSPNADYDIIAYHNEMLLIGVVIEGRIVI